MQVVCLALFNYFHWWRKVIGNVVTNVSYSMLPCLVSCHIKTMYVKLWMFDLENCVQFITAKTN